MATGDDTRDNKRDARGLHLVTPSPALASMREPTAGVDLMERHRLKRFAGEPARKVKRGFSHFLSPQLQAIVKDKPRVMLAEKADFGELLSEESSGWPIQELSIELLRRSFMIRRRVGPALSSVGEDAWDTSGGAGRPQVPPDVPLEQQITNKLSPAFMKKVRWVYGSGFESSPSRTIPRPLKYTYCLQLKHSEYVHWKYTHVV